ncbi:hypothetical protein G6F23_011255 [Rhizopus arrhizus]|nr:hypothetical protein G6F23_011255 [Rhizopus arrhizus]
MPTFRTISTINYLLITADLIDMVYNRDIKYVARCGHSAISIYLTLGCNPYLAQDPHFRAKLTAFCTNAEHFLPDLDTPLLWDLLKCRLKSFIQTFSNKAAAQLESQLELQYEHFSSVLALRSGQRWREQGERSNTYFYRCLRQRQQQQYISSIRTDTGTIVTEPLDLTETAREYYEQLYSPEPMDEQATSDLLAHVPDSASISPDVHESLINYWTVDEVSKSLQHTPTKSSPGVDGIPYVILRLLFDHPFIRQLFLRVLNTALRKGKYPPTWQLSVIILLPKKGDRSQLKDWISISLIFADAKIFTRLLTTGLTPYLSDLIDPNQTGFMAGRFIGDNGLCARMIMDITKQYKLPGVSLLLDQEKAYDRVHPDYLHACLSFFMTT